MDEAKRQSLWRKFSSDWGPTVGLIGGLIGILSGGLTLCDRFFPPTIKILDLIPVYISKPQNIAGANSDIRGIGILLHVQAENRALSLTGLELAGKRCLSFNEFIGVEENTDGKTKQELEIVFNRQRPFQLVSFFGWPTDRAGPISLTPWEESYARFTFLEPRIDATGMLNDHLYFGSTERPTPQTRRYGFNVLEMFTLAPSSRTSWTAGHLRNEILDSVLIFRVLIGGEQVPIPTNLLRAPKRLDPDTWKKGDLAPLLAEQWPSLEIKPTENREINCYPKPAKQVNTSQS